MRLFSTIFTVLFMTSCATIYTGNEYKGIDKKKLKKVDKSVTFRFITLHERNNVWNKKEKWTVYVSGTKFDPTCDYIKNLNLFNRVDCADTIDGETKFYHYNTLEDFYRDHKVDYKTDYFVDVVVKRPFYHHGSGTGMYGIVLSALTLGIIPSYWTYDGEYKINIESKEKKELFPIEYDEDYGMVSSTLFWLVPSSVFLGKGKQMSQMDKSSIEFYVEKIISKIKGKSDDK